jgi:hypothetical protein
MTQEEITKQVYELVRDLAVQAPDWPAILTTHQALAIGFGFAIGRQYASGPSLEAKLNVGALIALIDEAAQLGYERSQSEVADWRLADIVKEAGVKHQSQVQS